MIKRLSITWLVGSRCRRGSEAGGAEELVFEIYVTIDPLEHSIDDRFTRPEVEMNTQAFGDGEGDRR
ncbi:hypothetical protein J2Y58_003480 [Sphingomonas sp. BE138]|nr:hypothetical protein [Sphingomonas sp. BE138]